MILCSYSCSNVAPQRFESMDSCAPWGQFCARLYLAWRSVSSPNSSVVSLVATGKPFLTYCASSCTFKMSRSSHMFSFESLSAEIVAGGSGAPRFHFRSTQNRVWPYRRQRKASRYCRKRVPNGG